MASEPQISLYRADVTPEHTILALLPSNGLGGVMATTKIDLLIKQLDLIYKVYCL